MIMQLSLSDLKMVHLLGRIVAQHLSGSVVQVLLEPFQLGLAHRPKVGFLGVVPAHQPVRILVGAPLPGGVGVREVDAHASLLGQPFVLGHLRAVVVGHRLAKLHGLLVEPAGERPAYGLGLAVAELDQQGVPRLPLDDAADAAAPLGPDEQVALPVAHLKPALGLDGPCVDAEPLCDLGAVVRPLLGLPAP